MFNSFLSPFQVSSPPPPPKNEEFGMLKEMFPNIPEEELEQVWNLSKGNLEIAVECAIRKGDNGAQQQPPPLPQSEDEFAPPPSTAPTEAPVTMQAPGQGLFGNSGVAAPPPLADTYRGSGGSDPLPPPSIPPPPASQHMTSTKSSPPRYEDTCGGDASTGSSTVAGAPNQQRQTSRKPTKATTTATSSSSLRRVNRGKPVLLPNNFLCVPTPPSTTERGGRKLAGRRCVSMNDMTKVDGLKILPSASRVPSGYQYKVKVQKDRNGGIGVTVKMFEGWGGVVHGLPRLQSNTPGPAESVGVQRGDVLIGLNGLIFNPTITLAELVDAIKSMPESLVLSLYRPHQQEALADATKPPPLREDAGFRGKPLAGGGEVENKRWSRCALARILLEQKVVSEKEADLMTAMVEQLEKRSEEWENESSITQMCPGDASNGAASTPLPFNIPMPSFMRPDSVDPIDDTEKQGLPQRPASATTAAEAGYASMWSPAAPAFHSMSEPLSISMEGVRPALCIRILGIQYADSGNSYVLWVLDVESGAEWRLLRPYDDFQALHSELQTLRPSLSKLDFPPKKASLYDTFASGQERCRRLERYLRRIASLVFNAPLHRETGRIALRLQLFLDVPDRMVSLQMLSRRHDVILRQAVQVRVFRLLGLPVFVRIVGDFVQQLQSESLKDGMQLLQIVKQFIDHLQICLMDGYGGELRELVNRLRHKHQVPLPSAIRREEQQRSCVRDHRLLAEASQQQSTARRGSEGGGFDIAKEIEAEDISVIVRAGIRRQLESDVYVPLMERIHELVGDALQAEEASIQTKKTLYAHRYPQAAFDIAEAHTSPTNYQSSIDTLSKLDSLTLPYDKLDYLISAAKDIPLTYIKEHPEAEAHLGADDFLPIFIYTLLHAKINELVYLKLILSSLCDPDKRLSETGYYLATFEAAVEHLKDMEIAVSPETRESLAGARRGHPHDEEDEGGVFQHTF